jgi:hypothetical protein
MTKRTVRMATPPFLVGMALALGMQVAAGLLLYGGPGLLRALSVVLATGSLALAAGLASGGEAGSTPWVGAHAAGRARVPAPALPIEATEGARRRWLLLLVAFAAAAFFAGGWEIFRGFGSRGWSQGTGLAALVALPLYAGGRLLASPAFQRSPQDAPRRAHGGVGVPALTGAAVGFLALGYLLFPILSPTALFLLCVVATSGGALAHGRLLDEVAQVEVSDAPERAPAEGGVRVRWRRARPPAGELVWFDALGACVVRTLEGGPPSPALEALEMAFPVAGEGFNDVVAAGWELLPSALAVAEESSRILVIDPDPERVRWLAHELGAGERVHSVDPGPSSVAAWLEGEGLHAARIMVVATLLPRPASWAELARMLAPGGVLLVHGSESADPGGLLALLRAGHEHFAEAAAWVGPADAGSPSREGILAFRAAGGDPVAWPDRIGSLLKVLPGDPAGPEVSETRTAGSTA